MAMSKERWDDDGPRHGCLTTRIDEHACGPEKAGPGRFTLSSVQAQAKPRWTCRLWTTGG